MKQGKKINATIECDSMKRINFILIKTPQYFFEMMNIEKKRIL